MQDGEEELPEYRTTDEEPADFEDLEVEDDEEAFPAAQVIEEDSVHREVVLVALEAAALSRRAFPPRTRRRDLTAEGRQALLALSLVDPGTGLSAGELAHALSLGREETLEALAELIALGFAQSAEALDDSDVDYEDGLCATVRGGEVALDLARAARRAMPGWPPRSRHGAAPAA